jgi:16S rRNA (adenine1518-N6/adenine1519-N6)-dimethyltransferase
MNPKKSLGQHWLTDEVSIKAIAAAGELSKSDTVLEVGPGLGSLTRELVKTASSVIAVELDELLAEKLPSAVKADNLKLVKGSILEFDTTSLPQGYKVVANIPYYLTSNLLRVLSESPNPPARMVLLVQKEVSGANEPVIGQCSALLRTFTRSGCTVRAFHTAAQN